VTDVSTNGSTEFWEGDAKTFTATVSAGTPPANESFVWEMRGLGLITSTGAKKYHGWQPFPGAGSGPTADFTFNEPWIGQVRVKLISADTVTSKTIDVRAKAAYPVNFGLSPTSPPVMINLPGDHRLKVTYTYASSTGRPADLDGVEVGEFVWFTDNGYRKGKKGDTQEFIFPRLPFERTNGDGYYMFVHALDSTTGQIPDLLDYHGGGSIVGKSQKSVVANQQYLYKINDGWRYTHVSESNESQIYASDERGEHIIRDNIKILYNVNRVGAPDPIGVPAPWQYIVKKSYPGVLEAEGMAEITEYPFVIF